jgi:hypothetical protein
MRELWTKNQDWGQAVVYKARTRVADNKDNAKQTTTTTITTTTTFHLLQVWLNRFLPDFVAFGIHMETVFNK